MYSPAGDSYAERREAFYSSLRSDFWPELYGQENALFTMYPLAMDDVHRIHETARKAYHIYTKMARLLRNAPDDTLLLLDFPKSTLSYIRHSSISAQTAIGRFDLARLPDGRYVVLEFNADTPTFIKELFFVNELVCREFGAVDPNQGERAVLANAIQKAIFESHAHAGGTREPYVVFSSHKESESKEDYYTTLFLMSLVSDAVDCRFVPLSDLRVKQDGLYDLDGRKIDILYRQTYPIEHLCRDRDADGTPVGEMVMEHVVHGRLSVINPPSAFLLQSKAVQVAVWTLHEQGLYFSEEEHQWIEECFLPTYFEPDRFIKAGSSYVKKPSFGREGDTVEIYMSDGRVIREPQRNYTDSTPVYQQYVELPKATVRSLCGYEVCHLLFGCHVVGGEPSAIGVRAGTEITGNLSYYLPVSLQTT